MLQAATCKERIRGDQRFDDSLVGVALLAVVIHHAGGAAFAVRTKAGRVGGVEAGIINRERDLRADAARLKRTSAGRPGIKVLATMAGRGVHKAGAGIVGDVVAVEQRDGEGVAETLRAGGRR